MGDTGQTGTISHVKDNMQAFRVLFDDGSTATSPTNRFRDLYAPGHPEQDIAAELLMATSRHGGAPFNADYSDRAPADDYSAGEQAARDPLEAMLMEMSL